MNLLLKKLREEHPRIVFKEGNRNLWSSSQQTIYYSRPICEHSLLHELGHAINNHQNYQLDIDLINIENEAWESAKSLGATYNIQIKQSYIESCLDTYRDWLLKRSKCPECEVAGMQSSATLTYTCMNCGMNWKSPKRAGCVTKHIQEVKV